MSDRPLPDDPWSIGLFTGADPLHLAPVRAAPVMTRAMVTDVPAASWPIPSCCPMAGNGISSSK